MKQNVVVAVKTNTTTTNARHYHFESGENVTTRSKQYQLTQHKHQLYGNK